MSNSRSESIINVVKARIAAGAEIRNAEKNAKNPHLKNQYANLESVLEAIQPISQYGLALFHMVDGTNEEVMVTCMLAHESGEFLSCTLGVKPEKPTAQGIGSAITYARRYTTAAMLGITQADDDGNEASGVRNRTQQNWQSPKPSPTPAPKPKPQPAKAESVPSQLDPGEPPDMPEPPPGMFDDEPQAVSVVDSFVDLISKCRTQAHLDSVGSDIGKNVTDPEDRKALRAAFLARKTELAAL